MRLILSLGVALVGVVGTDAYTASNVVAPPSAGSGGAAISGYAVSDVRYELAGAEIASVSFSLDPPRAATTRIRVQAAGPWHDCELDGGEATCLTPGLPVAQATDLEIVASS